MKIQLIGLNIVEGVSLKTGVAKPYKINEILFLSENESYAKKDGSYKKEGFGKNINTLNVSDEIAESLKTVAYPKNAELEISADILNGRPVAKVVNVTVV